MTLAGALAYEHKIMVHFCKIRWEHILLPSKLSIEIWDLAIEMDLGRWQGGSRSFLLLA